MPRADEAQGSASSGLTHSIVVETPDGDEVVTHLAEVERPRGVVFLVHGVGEHARRYDPLARRLQASGYFVVAPDLLSHGATGRRAGLLGRIPSGGMRRVHRALRAVLEQVVAEKAAWRTPSAPVILLGHSWGSLLAQRMLADNPQGFDAAIFTGTTLAIPGYLNPGNYARRFPDDASGLAWLSRDEAAQRAFAADPDTFDIGEHPAWTWWRALELLGMPRPVLRSGGRDVPVLILAGSDDPIGYGRRGPTALEHAYRSRARLSDVTLRIYEGARHEVFNETNRDEVVGDLLTWLDARVPGRG